MLGAAYAWTQHGYLRDSWFNDPAVMPHLRSTSVGDLLATEDGARHWAVLAPIHSLEGP
jgi:hypothetical protein